MKKTLLLISITIFFQINAFSQNVWDLTGYTITAGQTSGENITYTDLIPDSSFIMDTSYKEFGIDVTYDGNTDLKFCCNIIWYSYTDLMVTSFIKIVNENMCIVVHPVDSIYAFPVNLGEEISLQDSWSKNDSLLLERWVHMPTYQTEYTIGYLGSGYVGFRINQEEPMYGWIKNEGSVEGPGITVSEHAISGEIIDGGADISENLMVICPNPAQNFVTLKGLDRTGVYKLFNLDGKLIKQGHLAPNESIDLTGIKQGMYLLNFYDSKKEFNYLVEVCF